MEQIPRIVRSQIWGMVILTTLVMVWSAWGQYMPPRQTVTLYDNLTSTEAYFFLPTSGTYKLQFTEEQDDVFPLYLVGFWDTATENQIAGEEFWQTTPACSGARTVTLQGGIYYRMRIDYAVGPSNPPNPGIICQARIFYTCIPK